MDIAQLLSCHGSTRSMRQSPELTVIKNIVRQFLLIGGQEVESVERLPYDTQLTYLVYLSDASKCVFKCSPTLSTRLLRREQHALETEARILSRVNRETQVPVPRRIKFASGGHALALRPPYLLRQYIPGTLLSKASPNLTASDISRIERELGAHYKTISELTATSFGTPQAVHAGNGSPTWRLAFLSMTEAILRDAEDMLINLPYDIIRHYVAVHLESLDALSGLEPQLTALSFCSHDKVLVDEDSGSIVGLLGLDDMVWGDPQMGLLDVSSSVRVGYGQCDDAPDENERRRALLYNVYRASVRIVKAHYRARVGEDELRAREELAASLNSLAEWPASS